MSSALRLVRHLLLADADVMAEANAVYPLKAPQAPQSVALPFLIIDLVSEDEWLRNLNGAAGQYEARVSVACHASSADGADTMAEVVKAAIGDLLNHEVTDGESPPARLGNVDTWMAGASAFDWSEKGDVFRRIVDFGVRWKP